MNRRLRTTVAVLAVAFAAPCLAAEPMLSATSVGAEVARAAKDVKNAFYRRAAVFSPGTYDQLPAAASAADLFPAYGFMPRGHKVSWGLSAVDEDQSKLCLTATLNSTQDWIDFVRGAQGAHLTPADGGCTGAAQWVAPAAYPVGASAIVPLDRRLVPTPTAMDAGLEVTGTLQDEEPAAVLPGHAQVAAVLQARAGQLSAPWTLTVTNRLPMQSLAIAGAAATPGFSLGDSSCAVLLPGESCSVAVRFQSSAQLPSTPGRVRLEFRQELEGLPTGGMSALSVTLYGEQVR